MSRHTPPRHVSRRAALQVLYAFDLAEHAKTGDAPTVRDVFERVVASFDLHEGARDFAWALVEGVDAARSALDDEISRFAQNWRVERMAAVDRNVLRIATFELRQGESPAAVVLDEAIELARDFGADKSPAFVNGVLDAIAGQRAGVR